MKPNERPEARLARLEQSGALRRSRTGHPLEALAGTKAPKARQSLVDALLEERRNDR